MNSPIRDHPNRIRLPCDVKSPAFDLPCSRSGCKKTSDCHGRSGKKPYQNSRQLSQYAGNMPAVLAGIMTLSFSIWLHRVWTIPPQQTENKNHEYFWGNRIHTLRGCYCHEYKDAQRDPKLSVHLKSSFYVFTAYSSPHFDFFPFAIVFYKPNASTVEQQTISPLPAALSQMRLNFSQLLSFVPKSNS